MNSVRDDSQSSGKLAMHSDYDLFRLIVAQKGLVDGVTTGNPQSRSEMPAQVDFVYLATDTAAASISEEICTWYKMVRIGGIIGGEYYRHPACPEVMESIVQFFGRFGWTIHHQGKHLWWVEKQSVNVGFFMPAFNCADTVQESVESIMAGNFTAGDELVIVDDGSTDGTAEVLRQLQEKYAAIKIVKHSTNRGGGAARNTAIENCGQHLLFCLDADNLLEPGSIRRLKVFFENTGADVAAFQELHYFKVDKQEIDFKWTFKAGQLTKNDIFSGTKVPGSSGNYMFSRVSWALAGGYPDVGCLDTWGFGFRQIMTGSKVLVMADSFYYHRYGHDSYWMRGAEKRKRAVSLMALQVLLPFSDQIDERYLDYIMSRKGRYSWFNNLQKHPLRLAAGRKKEPVWDNVNLPSSGGSTPATFINLLYRVVKQLLP